MGLSIARKIACDTLVRVMDFDEKPEDVLESLYAEHSSELKRLDRNFSKEIVFGSLRWYSKMFWILQHTSKRDLKKSTPAIRAALIAGTYQIFYMDRVVDRAAVNESVEYVRSVGQSGACTFVNGILRQIARKANYFPKPDKDEKPAEYLALQFAHPQWMVDRWLKSFKFAKLEVMLKSNNLPPPYTVRVNLLKTDLDDMHELQNRLLKEEKNHSTKRPLRSALKLKSAASVSEDSLFQQGYITYQDEASQLIAHLVNPEKDQTIIDTCCGPGGKLTHVFEMGEGNINLIGVEKNDSQYDKARQTARRLGHEDKISWVHADFLNYTPEAKVDKILMDAPCSGLGVIRRHPEAKWKKTPEIISKMTDLQFTLILHAIQQIKAGGELIYSVCSFETEESLNHLKGLLKKYPDHIEVVSPVSRLPDYYKRYVTRDNILSVYSGNKDEMDGFAAFIIKITKEFDKDSI